MRAELDAAAMTGSAVGQLALLLAARMCRDGETASGMAAVSKELSRVMATALGGAKRAADPLDELRRRRDAKRRPGVG